MKREEVIALLDALERGEVRAAAPDASGRWVPNRVVKEGILAAFRLGIDVASEAGPLSFRDRDTLPPRRPLPDGTRVVPGGTSIRRGAFLARGVVVMPPAYVNVGAYVDAYLLLLGLILIFPLITILSSIRRKGSIDGTEKYIRK